MTGFAELLLGSDLTEEQREHARLIAQSGRQLLALIERQLGGGEATPEICCNPREVAQGCVRLLLPQASAKGLHLSLWADDSIPVNAPIDPCRLRQVLLNLLGNAIKFTATGGVDAELRMEGSNLQIAVIDSGIGIARERVEDIFLPFSRATTSFPERIGGTGLGLTISRRLVASMGGTLSVHSAPGVGSNFTVRLPLASPACAAPRVSSSAPLAAMPSKGLAGERVLVAEDDTISRHLFLALAAKLGIEVCLAANGAEVIEAVRVANASGRPFRAILMDLQMPAMDGIETTRRLRAAGHSPRDLPVIALSASCSAPEIALCHEAGMQAHLAKPVTALALARELARFLPRENAEPDHCDLLLPFPTGMALKERYAARKQRLLTSLRCALERQAGEIDWGQLTGELHKIAGAAAHFGEENLGETARRLELRIRAAGDAEASSRELRRAWPLLIQVA